MRITRIPYHLPAPPATAGRKVAHATESPAEAQAMPRRPAGEAAPLAPDLRKTAVRGRPVSVVGPLEARRALAQYAAVTLRDERAGEVEVLGVDVYA